MTERQRRIHNRLRKANILATAAHDLTSEPIGYSTWIRLCLGFNEGYVAVIITKTPRGFEYCEQLPRGKGIASPRPRLLPTNR